MTDSAFLGKPLPKRRWEDFCRFLVFGDAMSEGKGKKAGEFPDTRNNATQAYIAAGYKAKSAQVASVCASKMLRIAKVQRRIGELRAVQDLILGAFLMPWRTLLPDAQQVLVDAMAGKEVKREQLTAAVKVIHLAEGRPRSRRRAPRDNPKDPPLNITVWP